MNADFGLYLLPEGEALEAPHLTVPPPFLRNTRGPNDKNNVL